MTRSSRLSAGLLAGATAIALVAPATTVTAQEASGDVAAAATWLVDQLVDGDHLAGEFGPQYGPTADVAYALLTTGQHPDVLEDVLAYMTSAEVVDAYVHGQPYESDPEPYPGAPPPVDDPTYVGANAKLGYLVTTAGFDPRDVAGDDLVENMLSLENEETGAFEDRARDGDFANLLGQSFALLFLHAADDVAPSEASIQYLVDAQCDDGGFPQDFGGDTCESQVDATGLVLQALVAVGADDAVDDARAWLRDAQDDDGSWGGNVNSTAYAGMGLWTGGGDVTDARAFLGAVQNDDGGLPISEGDPSDAIATAQALPLLAGRTLAGLAPATIERIAGENRELTAIEASRADFADGAASAVVLARSDVFADALAGTPLAIVEDGPLLITPPSGLTDEVLGEIERVLPEGGTVWILGGPQALPQTVDEALTDAGYEPERLQGPTRFETSIAIADALGNPDLQLITTGIVFADALTAGTAAAANGGAVLLTEGDSPNLAVTAYLDANPGERIAIGGPAARAYPDAEPVSGDDREATAVAVADRFFDGSPRVGVARQDVFADALAGGAASARADAPLLLTTPTELSPPTATRLCEASDQLIRVTVFGGPVAVADDVVDTMRDRVRGIGC